MKVEVKKEINIRELLQQLNISYVEYVQWLKFQEVQNTETCPPYMEEQDLLLSAQ